MLFERIIFSTCSRDFISPETINMNFFPPSVTVPAGVIVFAACILEYISGAERLKALNLYGSSSTFSSLSVPPVIDISPIPLFLCNLGFIVSFTNEVRVASSAPFKVINNAIELLTPAALPAPDTTGESASFGKLFFILSISDCTCTFFISLSAPKLNCTTTTDVPYAEVVVIFFIPSTFSAASSTFLVICVSTSSDTAPVHFV